MIESILESTDKKLICQGLDILQNSICSCTIAVTAPISFGIWVEGVFALFDMHSYGT